MGYFVYNSNRPTGIYSTRAYRLICRLIIIIIVIIFIIIIIIHQSINHYYSTWSPWQPIAFGVKLPQANMFFQQLKINKNKQQQHTSWQLFIHEYQVVTQNMVVVKADTRTSPKCKTCHQHAEWGFIQHFSPVVALMPVCLLCFIVLILSCTMALYPLYWLILLISAYLCTRENCCVFHQQNPCLINFNGGQNHQKATLNVIMFRNSPAVILFDALNLESWIYKVKLTNKEHLSAEPCYERVW